MNPVTLTLIILTVLLLGVLLLGGIWLTSRRSPARKPTPGDRDVHIRTKRLYENSPLQNILPLDEELKIERNRDSKQELFPHHEPESHKEITHDREVKHPVLVKPDLEMSEEIHPINTGSFADLPVPGGYEIPWGYGETKIIAQVRDPHWFHVYWEVHGQHYEELRRRFGYDHFNHGRPVIRVYDITGIDFNGFNAHSYVDVIIDDYARNWYIRVPQPNRTYLVDLGRILPDGQYAIVVRSNPVDTPRDSMSEKYDELWMLVDDNEKKLLERLDRRFGPSSLELFRRK